MPFPRRTAGGPTPKDPEGLYRLLAETNQGPSALWGHQQDVVRSWFEEHRTKSDVAIELPTGAGKTLVGGLIGEYQRRVAGDRVVYLCPTRQLARQTSSRLEEYGIPNVLLIGQAKAFNSADRAKYTSGRAIAVSVYHHVFNSNPALDDAQMLILDDAHAAEQAVAGPWSLSIEREEGAYQDVLALLSPALDSHVLDRLRTDNLDRQYLTHTYLASSAGVAAVASDIEAAIDTALATKRINDEARYAMKQLVGRLDRCLVYVSYSSILFRPLVTPTSVHTAFNHPARRLYMSATLGAGGELERAFGRRQVQRVAIPRGWDRQGTGRRLFCFPEVSPDIAAQPGNLAEWVRGIVKEHSRAVMLAPDERSARAVEQSFVPEKFKKLRGKDVEDDLGVFTEDEGSVLLLANRYDGIDLPDDDCRLVLIAGLPAQGDLQERFLYGSIGALEVLQERIRARFVQGAGRATRNAKDYATVLVLGMDLQNYVNRREVQGSMRAEVQAELAFGFDNSLANDSAQLADTIREFRAQSAAWQEANQEIVADREARALVPLPGTDQLLAAAQHEVAAWQAVWQGEWGLALISARKVLDVLSGGRDVQRYAALWYYLAGCWALRADGGAKLPESIAVAADYFKDARAAGRGTSWLDHLSVDLESVRTTGEDEVDPVDLAAARGVAAAVGRLGKASRFDDFVNTMMLGLRGTDARPYERALQSLGELAGAVVKGDSGADSAPDAGWHFEELLWVGWEAKSEAVAAGELGADSVRQAGGHLRFMAAEVGQSIPAGSFTCLVTPQATVHPSAHAVAEDHTFLVRPQEVLRVAEDIVRAWRNLRAGDKSVGAVHSALQGEGALPSTWARRLRAAPLAPRDGETL